MALPTLICPCQWEVPKNTTLAEQKQDLGDGYTQYMSVGINPTKVEWPIKTPVLTRIKANLIVSQLETFAGSTSFLWSPDNGATEPLASYYCDEWNLTPLAPNAFTLEATFLRDSNSECIALATDINTDLMKVQLAGLINFFNTYTRSTLPMVANAQGVTVNAFQTVEGRGGYFPNSVGTSEGQALIIEGILRAREYVNSATQSVALNLANLYSNALIQYFYQDSIPSVATSKLWLPHWLVNSKQSFISKGILRPRFINSGYFGIQVSFVNGEGFISTGNTNWGEKLSDVYRVHSVGGKLLWQNVYAPVSIGTEYSVNYWVSNPQLLGPRYRVYPTSSGNGGRVPLLTSENAGKVVLNSNFTGTLIIVYAAFTGAVVNINEPLEAFPITRPTQSNPKEKNHALDVSAWLHNSFVELYKATGNVQWKQAELANIHSTVLAAQVINDSYLFKVDLTSTDPFSYPGTQLITANNNNGGTASVDVNGWVVANILDSIELYPVAELQNFAVVLQLQPGVTVDISFGCSVTSIMEVYVSLSNNALDNSKVYTYYQPVIGGVNVSLSLLPSEFIKFNLDNWWHPRIAESPIYSYKDPGSNITTSIGVTTIEGSRRMVSTINMNKVSGGYTGAGFVMMNIGNEPPSIYYSKTGVSTKLKVTDSLNQVYTWTLPNTGGNWETFTPYWNNADSNAYALPGDGVITNVEILGDANGSSEIKIWWLGASPDILPYPCFTYKGALVSRVDTAHTFKIGNFRGVNSPLATLKGSPGCIPFTANMLRNPDGTYRIDAWRGLQIFVGYQDPHMWQEWGYSSNAQQVLDLFLDSQQAYAKQNTNNTFGPFAPAYNWPSWEQGVSGLHNTWIWKGTIDPNSSWGGYCHRALVNAAKYWKSNPKDIKANSIVMSLLSFFDGYYRRNNGKLPTDYPEFLDPVTNYISIQDYALVARAALFANLAGGSPSITYRVFKKSMDFLMSEYVSSGIMSGTFTKSQPNYTENGVVIKELFPFHHGEILITLSEVIKYKNQIRFPSCDVNLI